MSTQELVISDADCWRAVVKRDRAADGTFIVAVKTTGIYCRPSCASRRPNRENVEFFLNPAESRRAGYRACKRCKPDSFGEISRQAQAVVSACETIDANGATHSVSELAKTSGMSESQFHRVFRSQTGLTPKAYIDAKRRERLHRQLPTNGRIITTIYSAGFNSSAPFYAKWQKLIGMTPKAAREGGAGQTIAYGVGDCSLGRVLVAVTDRGICSIMMEDDESKMLEELRRRFPKSEIESGTERLSAMVRRVIAFVDDPSLGLDLPLDVRGTAFQHRVWKALTEIPSGQTKTYGELAAAVNHPAAVRAVARACGANPIAVAIPCHRIIGKDHSLTGYRWGVKRKASLLESEKPGQASRRRTSSST